LVFKYLKQSNQKIRHIDGFFINSLDEKLKRGPDFGLYMRCLFTFSSGAPTLQGAAVASLQPE
jgi:hypothetical protein